MSSLSNFSFSQFYQTTATTRLNPQNHMSKNSTLKTLSQTNNSFNSSINNTSRFQQKKVLQKLKQQNVLKRIQQNFNSFQQNDKKLKEWLNFKPIKSQKCKQTKQNALQRN